MYVLQKCVLARSLGLPGLNGLFTGGEEPGPKVRVTGLYMVSCLGSWSASPSGEGRIIGLAERHQAQRAGWFGDGAWNREAKCSLELFMDQLSFFCQMSLLSNKTHYSLWGDSSFPGTDRNDFAKDVTITGSDMVVGLGHGCHRRT